MSEHQIFAKAAWRLIPFMMLLYVVSFIDRTNAVFAALTMNKDLGFSPTVFGFGAGLFFVGYAMFQVPANLILERVGPKRWVFCISATCSRPPSPTMARPGGATRNSGRSQSFRQ
jgi:ACS family tartrate transporter-like MFS transporter